MPTLANGLVVFLMSLFRNREAAQEFLADPERALEDAGLGGVGPAEVDAVMPVIVDFAPITVDASSADRSYTNGGNVAAAGRGGAVAVTPPPADGHHGHDHDHEHAVRQLTNVVATYSWTSSVDDRDAVTEPSANRNIWADGDVTQYFENRSTDESIGGDAGV